MEFFFKQEQINNALFLPKQPVEFNEFVHRFLVVSNTHWRIISSVVIRGRIHL